MSAVCAGVAAALCFRHEQLNSAITEALLMLNQSSIPFNFFYFFFIEQLFLHLFGFLIHNKNTNLKILSLNRKNTLYLFHQSLIETYSAASNKTAVYITLPHRLFILAIH